MSPDTRSAEWMKKHLELVRRLLAHSPWYQAGYMDAETAMNELDALIACILSEPESVIPGVAGESPCSKCGIGMDGAFEKLICEAGQWRHVSCPHAPSEPSAPPQDLSNIRFGLDMGPQPEGDYTRYFCNACGITEHPCQHRESPTERSAFEQEVGHDPHWENAKDFLLRRDEKGKYVDVGVEIAWKYWQAAYQRAIEDAAKALCEWCASGKPFAEPIYGRTQEKWHRVFPEEKHDTQIARCHAEKIWQVAAIRKLAPSTPSEEKEKL